MTMRKSSCLSKKSDNVSGYLSEKDQEEEAKLYDEDAENEDEEEEKPKKQNIIKK